MSIPSSTGGREPEARDQPAGGRSFLDDDGLPPRRPRASTARMLVVAVLSIIASGVLFRVAVEILRRLSAP